MTTAGDYLRHLIRLAELTPSVQALYVKEHPGGPVTDVDALVVTRADSAQLAGEWAAAVGDAAYLAVTGMGAVAVAPDGGEIRLTLSASPAAPRDGTWRRVTVKGIPAPVDPAPADAAPADAAPADPAPDDPAPDDPAPDDPAPDDPAPDDPAPGGRTHVRQELEADVAAFWYHLHRTAVELGREHIFAAHGHLERCREALLGLYSMALAPGVPGKGWERIEEIPGAGKVLAGLAEWLVSPLESTALWRCAHRLGAAYESLMLPLAERVGVDYPFAMRNLAFQRLDQVRPGRQPAAPEQKPVPSSAPERQAFNPRPGRFRVKQGRTGRATE